MIGQHLGAYHVLEKLGEGGMGEVYRARDSALGRDVAIKVLPAGVSADAECMARFRREAQVLAALNHPNIAHVYGLEGPALVMEFVPGADLRGPLSIADALAVARQIAAGLEAAHERGIVHRDLKPANLRITPDGSVKILDFGLAKALDAQASSATADHSPTVTGTRAGTILGTAAYMAPEQAQGKPVDQRADIWAFGLIVYELLTGQRMYSAPTTAETMAQVILKEPSLEKLPAGTPRHIRWLLEHCLRKDPRARLRDIGDARLLLDPSPDHELPPPARRSSAGWMAATAALTLALAAASVGWWRATLPLPLHPMMRLQVALGADAAVSTAPVGTNLALSPDGTRLAVAYRGADGQVRLGTRLLSESALTPLSGTEDANSPFFSPDGQWIGFLAGGNLKKIRTEGGVASTICELRASRGVAWGDDNSIVLAASATTGLFRVSADGGTPVPLTTLQQGEVTHRWPQVLPGGADILFTSHTTTIDYNDASIEAFSTTTGKYSVVLRGGHSGRYVSTGHLLYVHERTLLAAPFDLKRLAVTGPSVPILEDVRTNNSTGGEFAVSDGGALVYVPGRPESSGWPVSWLDTAGKRDVVRAAPGHYYTPRISPDGKRVAYAATTGAQDDIWVSDLERDAPTRLTFLEGENRFPVWTPDGRHIAFQSRNPKQPGIYWVRSDASGQAQRLTDGGTDVPTSFSPDGKRLAFNREVGKGFHIWTAPIEGDADHPRLGTAEPFLETTQTGTQAVFSPDGRWVAYASLDTSWEVYVRPFPISPDKPGGKWQISSGRGFFPTWSRAGNELVFEQGRVLMAVSYTTNGDTFSAGPPRVWSPAPLLGDSAIYPNYDLAPDGKHVAAFLDDESQAPRTHVTILLNFFDELRRKAPGKNQPSR